MPSRGCAAWSRRSSGASTRTRPGFSRRLCRGRAPVQPNPRSGERPDATKRLQHCTHRESCVTTLLRLTGSRKTRRARFYPQVGLDVSTLTHAQECPIRGDVPHHVRWGGHCAHNQVDGTADPARRPERKLVRTAKLAEDGSEFRHGGDNCFLGSVVVDVIFAGSDPQSGNRGGVNKRTDVSTDGCRHGWWI